MTQSLLEVFRILTLEANCNEHLFTEENNIEFGFCICYKNIYQEQFPTKLKQIPNMRFIYILIFIHLLSSNNFDHKYKF